MQITIHQPEFMPWAGYFNKIARAEGRIIHLDSVKFQKNYFDNRCRLKQNGAAKWVTVPVKGRDAGTLIKDILIFEPGSWEKSAFSAFFASCGKAPFWKEHAPFLEATFTPGRWAKLVDLNLAVIEYVCRYLELPLNATRSSEMGVESKGSQLVLDLCLKAGADSYLSGAHGRDYLDEAAFAAAGVKLVYQDYAPPVYDQHDGPYIGPLTVFDLLLNRGRDARALIAGVRA